MPKRKVSQKAIDYNNTFNKCVEAHTAVMCANSVPSFYWEIDIRRAREAFSFLFMGDTEESCKIANSLIKNSKFYEQE
jgi:hypothetical protein